MLYKIRIDAQPKRKLPKKRLNCCFYACACNVCCYYDTLHSQDSGHMRIHNMIRYRYVFEYNIFIYIHILGWGNSFAVIFNEIIYIFTNHHLYCTTCTVHIMYIRWCIDILNSKKYLFKVYFFFASFLLLFVFLFRIRLVI